MATHLKNLFHFRACSHMQIRIAFVVGWISGYFPKAGGPIPEDIRTETQALRVEIQLARLDGKRWSGRTGYSGGC